MDRSDRTNCRLVPFYDLPTIVGIGEPDQSIVFDGEVVLGIELLTVVFSDQRHQISMPPGDRFATLSVFAGHEMSLPVQRVAVGVVTRIK